MQSTFIIPIRVKVRLWKRWPFTFARSGPFETAGKRQYSLGRQRQEYFHLTLERDAYAIQ